MKRFSFWLGLLLPLVLLGVVFASVDLSAVFRAFRAADIPLTAGAFVLAYLVPLLLLAWRWQWILRRFYGVEVGYRFLLAEYWTTLFLGYWVPGGVGSDVYRLVHVAKKAGGVAVNAAAIVGERFWALLVYGLLVLLTYPLVAPSLAARPQVRLVVVQIASLAALCVLALLVALLLGDSLALRLRDAIRGTVTKRLGGAAQALLRAAAGGGEPVTFTALLAPFFLWRNQAAALGLMALIQLITSVGGRLLLLALGVDLPLVVHVFIWALMNFFFLIPASIAGFGVREASCVILFGMFGVSRETSLAVSFLALACALVVIAPGGVIWLTRLLRPRTA